jgi:hypothetical protein
MKTVLVVGVLLIIWAGNLSAQEDPARLPAIPASTNAAKSGVTPVARPVPTLVGLRPAATTAFDSGLVVTGGAIIAAGFNNREAGSGKALEIGMDGTEGLLQAYDRTAATTIPLLYYASAHYLTGGNVVIGGTSPSTGAKLLVNYPANTTGIVGFTGAGGVTGDQTVLKSVYVENGATEIQIGWNSFGFHNPNYAYVSSSLPLVLQPTSGKVGIGVTNPAFALDVAGSINATGTVRATFQDVAEWVPCSGDVPPGTVVILNSDKNNEVMPSSGAYDTRVAGVVSARPGLLLGEAGASKAQIATTGRVRVRVDATKHAIRVGDLLVTSDTSGAAMKSEPLDLGGVKIHRPGTLIGKALEPLASGHGEILVLLSLQ